MAWSDHNSVIVPVDFSESSAPTIRTALKVVDDPAKIHLVHALVPLEMVSPGVAFGDLSDENREKHVREFAESFFQKNGLPELSLHVQVGHPGEVIVKYAAEKEADLVIVPSHGYHGLKRMVLGSTAEYVIRHVDCAVLVLRRLDAE